MAIITTYRRATPSEMGHEIDRCHSVIERLEADIATLTARAEAAERERDELRARNEALEAIHGQTEDGATVQTAIARALKEHVGDLAPEAISRVALAAGVAWSFACGRAVRECADATLRAEAAEANLAKAVEALSRISSRARWARGIAAEEVSEIARATLAEITDTGEMGG